MDTPNAPFTTSVHIGEFRCRPGLISRRPSPLISRRFTRAVCQWGDLWNGQLNGTIMTRIICYDYNDYNILWLWLLLLSMRFWGTRFSHKSVFCHPVASVSTAQWLTQRRPSVSSQATDVFVNFGTWYCFIHGTCDSGQTPPTKENNWDKPK